MTTDDAKDLPEHVRENRIYWDGAADGWVRAGERSWAANDPFWGVWASPQAELRMLPEDMSKLEVDPGGIEFTLPISEWFGLCRCFP